MERGERQTDRQTETETGRVINKDAHQSVDMNSLKNNKLLDY